MILHAIPEFALTYPGAGNWKAVHATGIALHALKVPVRRVVFRREDPGAMIEACTPEVSDVIVEYSYWGDWVRRLARARPDVRTHVRTHNAEALQHWQRVAPCWRTPAPWARTVYGSLRMLRQDALCRRAAFSLLGINPWEIPRYWRHLPGRARLEHMPYFCPWPALNPDEPALPWTERRRMVLSLPGGFQGRFHRDQLAGLERLMHTAEAVRGGVDWTFGCSRGPDLEESPSRRTPGIRYLEATTDVWALLRSVRVVAFLSDLGFGLKTTVVDALAAGCQVLVTPGLQQRLPEAVGRRCLACVPDDPASVAEALRSADEAPQTVAVNTALQQEAERVLRGVLRACQGSGGTGCGPAQGA